MTAKPGILIARLRLIASLEFSSRGCEARRSWHRRSRFWFSRGRASLRMSLVVIAGKGLYQRDQRASHAGIFDPDERLVQRNTFSCSNHVFYRR